MAMSFPGLSPHIHCYHTGPGLPDANGKYKCTDRYLNTECGEYEIMKTPPFDPVPGFQYFVL